MRTKARGIVNKALLILGQMTIVSDTLFNTGIMDSEGNLATRLDKYQQQAVTIYDVFHSALAMTMNKPFMYRRFCFSTLAGRREYTLNNVIFEGLRANSFFNITAGGGGDPIRVFPYQRYNEMYADENTIPLGRPFYLFPVPDGVYDSDPDECKILLAPTPDQAYKIEGQCRFLVEPLKDATDPCCFPYRYEHALVMKLVEVMETRMNEGREGSIHVYAEQFIEEVLRDACGAHEEIDAYDPGLRLYGGGYETRRDYNPLTDVPGAYP